MTTTPAIIRTSIVDRIIDLIPTRHASDRFQAHREEMPFIAWATANPTGCLRRFSVTWSGAIDGPDVSDTLVEHVRRDLDILIAYPTNWRRGGTGLVTLEDAIAEDVRLIAKTVGQNGQAALALVTTAASITNRADAEDTLLGEAVSFGRVGLTAHYYRSAA